VSRLVFEKSKTMLLRISLIVAISAGLGAGVVSYLEVSDKIPALTKQRDSEHTAKVTALADLFQDRDRTWTKTKSDLAQTQQELADTKSDRDKAVARAETQSKRADELADELAKATQERDDIQTQLTAYKATDLTPEQVAKLSKTLKEYGTADCLPSAERKSSDPPENCRDRGGTCQVHRAGYGYQAPRQNLKGKIIVVDPKWDFVVLDIGERSGAIPDGELLVSRDGKLVAKVVLRETSRKDRSVANILPGWKLGELIEGDLVTPGYPAS
jgi:hypothetical protein